MSYTKIENMFQNLSLSLCVSVYTHSPRRETETDLTRIFRNVYYANLANVYYFGQNLAHHDFSEGQISAILLWCLIQEVHWCITKK